MKHFTSSPVRSLESIVEKVRKAQERVNTLLLDDRIKPKKERMETEDSLQKMRGILVDELHDIDVFPEDAYEVLYQYSVENPEDLSYMEELMFLEHVI